jgi:hypothetical protein
MEATCCRLSMASAATKTIRWWACRSCQRLHHLASCHTQVRRCRTGLRPTPPAYVLPCCTHRLQLAHGLQQLQCDCFWRRRRHSHSLTQLFGPIMKVKAKAQSASAAHKCCAPGGCAASRPAHLTCYSAPLTMLCCPNLCFAVEIVLESDLVDSCKPGDRVAIVGIFRPLASANGGTTSGAYRCAHLPSHLMYMTLSRAAPISSGQRLHRHVADGFCCMPPTVQECGGWREH